MNIETLGFIGAGRVTAFLLEGLRNAELRHSVIVTDIDPAASAGRAVSDPFTRDAGSDFSAAARADIVFLALHPKAVASGVASIAGSMKLDSIVISLAPRVTIASIRSMLGSGRVARFLPSAPSAIRKGFNPIAFSPEVDDDSRASVKGFLGVLGEVPEVDEAKLEAYAVVCAMGPTYVWPILDELTVLAAEFGLSEIEARHAVASMTVGAAEFFSNAKRPTAELMDFISGRPLAEDEAAIRGMFRVRLKAAYDRLKG